jgi:hypothetical protein
MSLTKQNEKIINLQLGDIIHFEDPVNDILNNHTFLIDYIDDKSIKLIEINDLNMVHLKINNNLIIPETVTKIDILFRNEKKGFCLQNNLLPKTWINVFFSGDMPFTLTGEITKLEEDMIEVKSFPDNEINYLNFAYKGIPDDLSIQSIEIRAKPQKNIKFVEVNEEKNKQDKEKQDKEREIEQKNKQEETDKEKEGEETDKEKEGEETDKEKEGEETDKEKEGEETDKEKEGEETDKEKEGEEIERETEGVEPIFEDLELEHMYKTQIKDVKNKKNEFIIRANEVIFGKEYEPIKQLVNVDVSQKRFDIETQTNDLLNDLLSKLSNSQKTKKAMNNIHQMIDRFKELRTKYSSFDENGNILDSIFKGIDNKPLLEYLLKFNNSLYWLLPVAKNVKKIYENETLNNNVVGINKFYLDNFLETIESNNLSEEQNKYDFYLNEIYKFGTPFEQVNSLNSNDIIYEKEVNSDMSVIIDTLGNQESFAIKSLGVKDYVSLENKRFFIERYNTGITRLDTLNKLGSKTISKRIQVTPSDTIQLKSIITLPEPTIRFSRINLPGTNILEKTNLNFTFLNYWQLLKKNTKVTNVDIDNLNVNLVFEKDNYFNNIKNYVLNNNLETTLTKNEVYRKFIELIVPKIRTLFNLVKKHIKGKLSFVDVISYLEPFLVYTDDLTYMQYKDINRFLYEEISNYNKNFVSRKNLFNLLKKINIGINEKPNFIAMKSIFYQNRDILNNIFNEYNIENNSLLTNSSFLRKVLIKDNGQLFNYACSLKNLNLMLSEDISKILSLENEAISDEIKNLNKNENTKCSKYVISKQYKNEEELMEDNGKTIYFDKKFDKTKYDIIDEFDKNKIKMSSEDFNDYLVNQLEMKHNFQHEDAKTMAETLISGFKKVENGNIAILYSFDDNVIKYYKRNENRWEFDEDITKSNFLNTDDLLCNFQQNCINIEDKYNSKCESFDLNKKEITKNTLKDIVNQFDKNYKQSKELLQQTINKKYDYYSSIINKLTKIEFYNVYKNTLYQYNIGIEDIDNKIEIPESSPYLKLRDLILGQPDFVKKQSDIIRFTISFTRQSIQGNDEDANWLYCIKTNAKLLPAFIYKLASCFTETPDKYLLLLNEICAEIGTISDDGDNWVDKHSGYIIRPIDFDFEEGYNEEGFKMVSRDIIEEDIGITMLNNTTHKIEYTSLESRTASNIITSLSEFMGINIEEERNFMVKIINNVLPVALAKESDYKKKIEEYSKRGKNIQNYNTYYNTTILYLTFSSYLIGVQTSIPSIKTRKTYPGCVRSFEGFPFDGTGDLSALSYLACIISKITNKAIEPWSAISRKKEDDISSKIKDYTDRYFLNDIDVINKFKEKTDYLLINPTEKIPSQYELNNWNEFLPPLNQIKINKLSNVSTEFTAELLREIKYGSSKQNEKLLIVKSKIIFFSLAIQESIQKIINKKKLILKNASNEPFLENACCNTINSNITTVIEYFENEDSSITDYNNIVSKLSNIIYDINAVTKSPFLFSKEITKNVYSSISNEFNEEIIYRAFIHFCKFQSNIILSDELLTICNNKPKPNTFNISDSINEKIQKLKNDGRNYKIENMLRLLQVVSRQNIIHIENNNRIITPLEKFKNIIEVINDYEDPIVSKDLVKNIEAVVNSTEDIAIIEDTPEIRNLKNYLIKTNNSMKSEIMEFINSYSNISTREKNNLKKFLDNLMVWSDLNDATTISDNGAYNAINFMKSYITNFVKIFPNIILNKVDFNNVAMPKYLGLSTRHESDIMKFIKDYYNKLCKFYGDIKITKILSNVIEQSRNILHLANDTPCFSNISYNDKTTHSIFDRTTNFLLFENYLLKLFTYYINLTNNNDMLNNVFPVDENVDDLNTIENIEDNENQLFAIRERDNSRYLLNTGNIKELKTKIAELISTFLNIMNDNKNTINISYDKIMDNIFKLKEKEKNKVTDRLKSLTNDERNVDTMLKVNKLGLWNKGLQKGLTQYDKNVYDEEVEDLEDYRQIISNNIDEQYDDGDLNIDNEDQNINIERVLRRDNNVDNNNIQQYLDDYNEEKRISTEIDEDVYDMSNMNDDYGSGDYDFEGPTDKDYDDVDYY